MADRPHPTMDTPMAALTPERIDWTGVIGHLVKPLTARVGRDAIRSLSAELEESVRLPRGILRENPEEVATVLETTLFRRLGELRGVDEQMVSDILSWRDLYLRTIDSKERARILTRRLEGLGSSWSERRRDLKALQRQMDWDALEERMAFDQWAVRLKQIVILESLTGLYTPREEGPKGLFRRPDPDQTMAAIDTLTAHLETRRFVFIRRAALETLTALVRLHPDLRPTLFERYGDRWLELLDQPAEDRWLRVQILDLLGLFRTAGALFTLHRYLEAPDEKGDRMILRAHALKAFARINGLGEWLLAAFSDPRCGEVVRLAAVEAAAETGLDAGLQALQRLAEIEPLRADSAESVRARLVESLAGHLASRPDAAPLLSRRAIAYLEHVLGEDPSPVVRRVAQEEAKRVALELHRRTAEASAAPLVAALQRQLERDAFPGESERIAGLLEELSIESDETLHALRVQMLDELHGEDPVPWGGRRRLRVPPEVSPDQVMRVLASIARFDAGLYARFSPGGRLLLQRGERFGRCTWRVWHEIRHPKTPRRPDHPHTLGRLYRLPHRAHPEILAEVTPTSVPGERVLIESEGGWGRYLPLLDDLLECTRELSLHSSFGVTRLRPPGRLDRRLAARTRLTFAYASYHEQRTLALKQTEPKRRARFVETLRSLGFTVEFVPHRRELFGIPVSLAPARVLDTFGLEEES